MTAMTMIEAIHQALHYSLSHDPNVVVLGEDVGINGGVFRATQNLQQEFGEQRVLDTPLAENMIAGISVGMAAMGLKPVAEIQFMDFICSSIDQILSHASRLRNRTRGRLTCPMVLRTPSGGGIRAPEHHSDSMEALFSQIPGLRVVIPSSPAKAYGLLLAAIEDPDPVIFMEPKRIYRLVKEEVPNQGEKLPLDVCFVLRQGSDVTLVSWGAMLHETMLAAQKMAENGIECEVIDVVTAKPLDIATIVGSVNKTGRCVIVQEANPTCSLSADIAAQLAKLSFTSLLAPIERVCGYDTIMPLYRLEKYFLPSVERILSSIKTVLEYA